MPSTSKTLPVRALISRGRAASRPPSKADGRQPQTAAKDRTVRPVQVTGPRGPVPFLDLFQGRDELVVYQHMWFDGAPYQGQCEGCTTTAWHVKDAVYLNARGVSFAVLTSGPWDEVAPCV